MFYVFDINDVVRIPPEKFRFNLKDTIKDVVSDLRVGYVDSDLGVILGVIDVKSVGEASVILGDGAGYVDTTYNIITYKPELQEVIEGEVKEIAEFGAFISTGPFDGLVHVSQIMDDFINFDNKNYSFAGRDSNKVLHKGESVISRIVSVSLKENVTKSKIGLTMRQSGLGKDDWANKVIDETATEKDIKKKRDNLKDDIKDMIEPETKKKVKKSK